MFAKDWLNSLRHLAKSRSIEWYAPQIGSDVDGTEVIMWYGGSNGNTLTLYVNRNESYYLKAWGPSIVDDMEDGEFESVERLLELYLWLQEKP